MPLKHCHARVEFLALKTETEALLADGHSCREIYVQFRKDGRISMSYGAFMYHARPLRPARKKPEPPDQAETARQATGAQRAGKAPAKGPAQASPAAKDAAPPVAKGGASRPMNRIGGSQKPKFTDTLNGYDGIGIAAGEESQAREKQEK